MNKKTDRNSFLIKMNMLYLLIFEIVIMLITNKTKVKINILFCQFQTLLRLVEIGNYFMSTSTRIKCYVFISLDLIT